MIAAMYLHYSANRKMVPEILETWQKIKSTKDRLQKVERRLKNRREETEGHNQALEV